MFVPDVNHDLIAKNMDVIEETTKTGVPDPLVADYTLYIPDFVPFHVHGKMTEEEMIAAHDLFLKRYWLTPGLTAEINRHFPRNKDLC